MKPTLPVIALISVLIANPSSGREEAFVMPAQAPKKEIIPAAELARKWQQAETRTLNAPPSEERTANVSPDHLAAIRKSGADRGIAVAPAAGGQSQVTVNVNPDSSVSFTNILFKLNSIELADGASRRQVEQIAEAIKASGGKLFVLEGHTCDLGADAHNQSLSERRSAAILSLLAQSGVNASQLLPLGFGEARPAAPNTSEVNREENRRVVVSLRAS